MIKKGTYVEVVSEVLSVEDRAKSIPEDTKNTPLRMWVRGHVLEDCELGDEVKIETSIGRIVTGVVEVVEPYYNHNFGRHVEEISYIGKQAKKILFD
ncbi:MAG: 2-amino-4-ketopentanoate thiolase [Clostridium argentinense]|uniref:2-amino-4-ketopentanoate thiolase n=1 Tax=Clostridium faecium TaxID=2762223 RepID=A0ABR8YWI0_9CLOT|nr:2-amino-4-oxopentanoate thiolase subunit OrtA [Clostridium faecium]MBD8048637.1 2-amino-4-ketopentanoate thiolase [Clostridium faecium]MBS5822668.1 2-amino-4-ketopentanoate thiolase [Clostridium argentinense]